LLGFGCAKRRGKLQLLRPAYAPCGRPAWAGCAGISIMLPLGRGCVGTFFRPARWRTSAIAIMATTAAITRSAMRVAPSPSLFQRDRVMVASAEMDARTAAGDVCESQRRLTIPVAWRKISCKPSSPRRGFLVRGPVAQLGARFHG